MMVERDLLSEKIIYPFNKPIGQNFIYFPCVLVFNLIRFILDKTNKINLLKKLYSFQKIFDD